MPADEAVSINLLGSEKSEFSPLGRFINWVTTYGRYIMITTEAIVLIAFISRFSLDRTLTDLKDEISQKQQIIAVNQDLEQSFRQTQNDLVKAKSLLSTQFKPVEIIETLHTLLPVGTYFQSLAISEGKISSQVVSLTVQSFSQFLLRLSATKSITNIEIGTLDKQGVAGIQYTMNATIVGAK